MEIKEIAQSINLLIKYWEEQGVSIIPKPINEIGSFDSTNLIPKDFIELYTRANGMYALYPNETDDGGFLFYPLEEVISLEESFERSMLANKERIFLFAEYQHESWWYGYELKENNEYIIGIVPDDNTFKKIADSLSEFIQLYIEDSPKLYDYLI